MFREKKEVTVFKAKPPKEKLIDQITRAQQILQLVSEPSGLENKVSTSYRKDISFGLRSFYYFSFIVCVLSTFDLIKNIIANDNKPQHEGALIVFFSFCTFLYNLYQVKNTTKQLNQNSIENIINQKLIACEKTDVQSTLDNLGINFRGHTLETCLDFLDYKKKYLIAQENNKLAFLMGEHPRLGRNSILHRHFFRNSLLDKRVCHLIFEFADFSAATQKNKTVENDNSSDEDDIPHKDPFCP